MAKADSQRPLNSKASSVTFPFSPTAAHGAPIEGLPQAARPMISIQKVEKTYPARAGHAPVTALSDVDLEVAAGEIVGVIGRSGAGKSTLIRLVNGLERATKGTVTVDGTDLTTLRESELRQARRSIGMIFQHFNLLARRTAFDNVAMPLEIAGFARRDIEARVKPLLDLVGLADKADRYPAELSGGQKQRVGIARALATNPKVLLSDEATSALDPDTTKQILALLKKVNAELGITILLITHEMSVISAITDRVAVIDGGTIVEQGPTFDVFTAPRHATTQSFVSSVTGTALPEAIAQRLQPAAVQGAQALVRIVFRGTGSEAAFLSRISREEAIDLSIVQGRIDEVAGQTYGQLIVSVTGGDGLAALERGVAKAGLTSEVLGYVR
jgi:D-methionine transport system ATP-binding protein